MSLSNTMRQHASAAADSKTIERLSQEVAALRAEVSRLTEILKTPQPLRLSAKTVEEIAQRLMPLAKAQASLLEQSRQTIEALPRRINQSAEGADKITKEIREMLEDKGPMIAHLFDSTARLEDATEALTNLTSTRILRRTAMVMGLTSALPSVALVLWLLWKSGGL